MEFAPCLILHACVFEIASDLVSSRKCAELRGGGCSSSQATEEGPSHSRQEKPHWQSLLPILPSRLLDPALPPQPPMFTDARTSLLQFFHNFFSTTGCSVCSSNPDSCGVHANNCVHAGLPSESVASTLITMTSPSGFLGISSMCVVKGRSSMWNLNSSSIRSGWLGGPKEHRNANPQAGQRKSRVKVGVVRGGEACEAALVDKCETGA